MCKLGIICTLLFMFPFGCASATIPVNYTAQNTVRIKGAMSIGEFRYLPTEEGKVKPNQVKNTAMGAVYIGANIADLVRRATVVELEQSGISIAEDSPLELSGDVIEFTADDFGYSVDWSYSVRYRIVRAGDLKPVLDKVYEADRKKTGKTGAAIDFGPSICEMIRSSFERFVGDPEVRAILKGK